MTRRSSRRAAPALLILPCLFPATWAQPTQRPNLLVVTFDTTRADRLPPYGYTEMETPAISRLAAEGATFLRAYSQSPQTLPSHASLFTGHYTITHNVRSNGQRLENGAITLAEALTVEGYHTGAIVATAALMQDFNLNQGFRTYDDQFEDPALTKAVKSFFRFFSRNKINLYSTRDANRVTALAKKWLNQASNRKRPFFLWLHYFDPHTPYVHREDFEHPGVYREDGPRNRFGELEENYVNEIRFADHYLGKVLKHMDRLKLLDNTLVVFTADHGESLGEHGYQGHRREVYENIIQIPLILRFPSKIQAGVRPQTPAMSIDVAPTALSLLEIQYPDSAFAGVDLFGLPADQPRQIFSLAVKLFTKTPIRTALVYGDRKYIQFDDSHQSALFDLRADPLELNDLFRTEAGTNGVDWNLLIAEWFKQYEKLSASDFQMTPEQMERLRSLGYIEQD